MRKTPLRLRRALTAAFLALGLLLSISGTGEKALDAMGLRRLNEANSEYLEASFDRSLDLFIVLSSVKVVLAMVEGSQAELGIGIGISFQLGDVVQAAYDHVDVAWRTVLAGAVILKAMIYFLATADLLDQWFLSLTFFLALVFYLARWTLSGQAGLKRTLRDICIWLTVITSALVFLLPIAIMGGRYLSGRITAPALDEAEIGITRIQRQLKPAQTGDEGLFALVSQAKTKITEAGVFVKERLTDLTVYLFTIMAIYIFDCVIFPLFLFVFLLWFTRLVAQYLFGQQKSRNFREDLETILTRFYGKSVGLPRQEQDPEGS